MGDPSVVKKVITERFTRLLGRKHRPTTAVKPQSVGLGAAGRRHDSVHSQVLDHLPVMVVGVGDGKRRTVQASRRSTGLRRL